jgi:hypothetical protein
MRDAWACCVTLAAREYDPGWIASAWACTRSWRKCASPGSPAALRNRCCARFLLFPRYFFIPIPEARARQLRRVRGLCGHQYLLASAEGRIWEAPGPVIAEFVQAEKEGRFDEVPPSLGDRVKIKGGGALSALDLIVSSLDEKTAQLFVPLFGGSKATVQTANLTRAG